MICQSKMAVLHSLSRFGGSGGKKEDYNSIYCKNCISCSKRSCWGKLTFFVLREDLLGQRKLSHSKRILLGRLWDLRARRFSARQCRPGSSCPTARGVKAERLRFGGRRGISVEMVTHREQFRRNVLVGEAAEGEISSSACQYRSRSMSLTYRRGERMSPSTHWVEAFSYAYACCASYARNHG